MILTLFKSEPAVIIGSLITLIEALAIPHAGKAIAVLTFIGALATRQTVFSPAKHDELVNIALNTPVELGGA